MALPLRERRCAVGLVTTPAHSLATSLPPTLDFALDDFCDEPSGDCAPGTDTTDCG
jgi:hypothetical protein